MLYIFDLDGTLITSYMDRADKDYHEWSVLRNRIAKLDRIRASGDSIAIATNQAGIGFGFVTVIDYYNKIEEVCSVFDISTAHVWACFAHPKVEGSSEAELWRRKPNPGMLLEAMDYFGVEPVETMMIGDMETDHMAAVAANVLYSDAEVFFA